jgi:hypothetical protein
MPQKKRAVCFIYRRGLNTRGRIAIDRKHTPLAAGESESRYIQPQRQHREEIPRMDRGAVAKENDAEVAPTRRPIFIHFPRRSAQTEKMLIVFREGHVKLAPAHRLRRLESRAPNISAQPNSRGASNLHYLPLYTLSKNPSSSSFLSQLESMIRSALIAATLGFCSVTYLITVLVPSTVG